MTNTSTATIIRSLDDGLILRHATPQDAENLSTFNARVHSDAGPDQPEEPIAAWTQDLLTRPHPTFSVDDFTIVEESASGKIVSSLNLISQTWSYDGIPFKVGRPELVGTLPEFRNRGLVRIQFDEVHRWSQERGELVQAITGIPYYYRLFGYEMGLELGGGRAGYQPHLPKLKDGETEPYRMRTATPKDIPFLMEVNRFANQRQHITSLWDEALWRYELQGKSEQNINRFVVMLIEQAETGEAVGYLMHPWRNWGDHNVLRALAYELKPGVSWLAVTPSVARYLWQTGEKFAQAKEKQMQSFGFSLGTRHPAYQVMHDQLPRTFEPYAWYIRVADLAAFFRQIAPALEKRIANSLIPKYSGSLQIAFYHTGLKMVWEQGALKEVENLNLTNHVGSQAAFPYHSLISLVFGRSSLEELCTQYPDCYWETNEARIVLKTLFPKRSSNFMAIA